MDDNALSSVLQSGPLWRTIARFVSPFSEARGQCRPTIPPHRYIVECILGPPESAWGFGQSRGRFSRTTVLGAELLFETVSRGCERTSLIVATNLPFQAWVDAMGSERLTGTLLGRLTRSVHILAANGPRYRLREAKRRLRKQASSYHKNH